MHAYSVWVCMEVFTLVFNCLVCASALTLSLSLSHSLCLCLSLSLSLSLRLFDEEGDSPTVDLTEVYDLLSFAEFKMGNVKRAAHYTRLLLQNSELLNTL